MKIFYNTDGMMCYIKELMLHNMITVKRSCFETGSDHYKTINIPLQFKYAY